MITALIIMPTLAGLLAFLIRPNAPRRVLLLLSAITHTSLTAACWFSRPAPVLSGWLMLDAPGVLFLGITSVIFLVASVYAVGYLGREDAGRRKDFEEGVGFINAPEKVFTGTLLFFLAAMTLVAVSQHFGLLWVAVEATTLASAPLIYFHRHHRSLEATWKYLLICSVGIALALLGNFFLAVAASVNDGSSVPLVLNDMLRLGTHFNIPWLKAAFLFLLVGYGTKMGLAPLHTWLPDAHSEAPSVVSALLSGALLNCAFLGILRAQQVLNAAGQAAFGRELLLLFGLASMAVAAVFIVSQADYKRMLAYSSVEHMGILSIGIGLGGTGAFGAMLHAVNHSVTKAMLFLVAGNILTAFRTKRVAEVQGVLGILPVSGVLWVGGFLAITGSPPFGPFLSEFTIFKAAVDGGNGVAAVVYLILLALIFIGMITAALRMAQGAPEKVAMNVSRAEGSLSIASPLALALLILLLGVYIPPPLRDILREAARVVGG
jgi:hydrogenase-4 component F